MELIRKIIVGVDPLKAMAYYIGQAAGEGTVNAIVLDEKHLHHYGERRYLIYIERHNDGIMLWKRIENMPVLIEFDLKF